MKKIYFMLAFLLAASFSFAAESPILKELGKVKTLSGDFVQTNYYKEPGSNKTVSDSYSGKVFVVMKDKALFEYTSPYAAWYLFGKGIVETYDSITNQLVKVKDAAADNIFLKVLTDFSAIGDSFAVKEEKDGALMLEPKKDLGIKYFEVVIAPDKKISSMKTEDVLGNITEMKFKNMKIDEKIPGKVFDKKVPANAAVIER